MEDIFEFIRAHGEDDTSRLLLGKAKWPDIDMDLVVNTIEGRRRMAVKVPEWAGREDLLYPTRLCTEQCSSSATAGYKCMVLKSLRGNCAAGQNAASGHGSFYDDAGGMEDSGNLKTSACNLIIADLTGGLGVDSWFFSRFAEKVLYNEMDPLLATAAERNFKALGACNITVRNLRLEPGCAKEILGGLKPDIIFLDPARRASDGRKVFRIEDCTPDVMSLKEELLGLAPSLVLKLSPMADISNVVKSLGHVTEVHCIGAAGECKELLVVMERAAGDAAEPDIVVADEYGEAMRFRPSEEKAASVVLPDELPQGGLMFEPSKAVAKAGCFRLLCSRLGLRKIGRSTHLYIVPDDLLAAGQAAGLRRLGKLFEIKEIRPLNNRSIKELASEYPGADISARNLPMDTAALTKKMYSGKRTVAGNTLNTHIFGVRADFSCSNSANYLLVTRPVQSDR